DLFRRLHKGFGRNRKKAMKPQKRNLLIERLEDRTLFAANVWNNLIGDGNWNTAGNWSLGHVPTTGDTATFNATSTANCLMNQATASCDALNLASGYTGTFTIGTGNQITFNLATANSIDMTLASGTFAAGTGTTIIDKGGWNQTGGTFTPGTSTVQFGW